MHTRMDAAVTVDAQTAPTATWKTAQSAVSHSAHTHHPLLSRGNPRDHRPTHKEPDSPKQEGLGLGCRPRSAPCG